MAVVTVGYQGARPTPAGVLPLAPGGYHHTPGPGRL